MQRKHVIAGISAGALAGVGILLAALAGCEQAITSQSRALSSSATGASNMALMSEPITAPGSIGKTATSLTTTGGRGPVIATAANEEIWVIQRPADEQAADAKNDVPGTGSLLKRDTTTNTTIPIPLKHTDVSASITGYIASVDVKQQFQNPFSEKIEAVYVFPLPHNAAVNEFVMTVGDRHIHGLIREKAEAQRIYNEAKNQGYVASLMTQQRPNIFTQSVANIEPGKTIDIDIRYFNTLTYVDGWYEWVFPMVVGPRYNPAGSADPIVPTPRGGVAADGHGTVIPYLAPNERSGHDIAVNVSVDAGVGIEDVACPSHQIVVSDASPTVKKVKLNEADSIPNRDFILRYKVAGGKIKTGIFTQRDEKGNGYFAMMLFPPAVVGDLPRQPMEMVFTLDVSGSQSGQPFAQEKAATIYALQHMGPKDMFQVVRFGYDADRLFPTPQPADQARVSQALQWINGSGFFTGGGTELIKGVDASLDFPPDRDRLRFVCFMTDGFIGNEAEALGEIHNHLGASRLFSLGVGSSTNRFLLDGMAKMGRGAVAYLALNDDAGKTMDQFYSRISHPALTNVSIDYGTMGATNVYPTELPDLFVGRPVIIAGRFTGSGMTTIHVHGKCGGQDCDIAVPIDLDAAHHPALPAVWARAKIADLSDRATYEQDAAQLTSEIRETALKYGLMSQFTSFVAVDDSHVTAGDHGVTVGVTVPVPEGVRYDTTVTPRRE
ncbi:MAG TPA: VIT domain-containing protein [Tepidisphaeraceae bacterium]|jgi:Ca-activated chloride channel family protein|nr:VIT domain-containing protein [Tepidisphaeraceae bacterium]